jgi:hypothetical protein
MIYVQTAVFFLALLFTIKAVYAWIDNCMWYMKQDHVKDLNGMYLVFEDYISIILWSLLFFLKS